MFCGIGSHNQQNCNYLSVTNGLLTTHIGTIYNIKNIYTCTCTCTIVMKWFCNAVKL